ncbi:MAG TPA: FtsW/RodA/SpoVE family cell cycle protein, partial [Beutenbergiaceae bacterium]|nr:FtsW/RodA/SpoVE family cell cycle protein [Beutenbergiaceae bacterium]
ASTVYSLRETGGKSTTSWFTSQARYALMAIPVAIVIAHLPLRWLRALVWPAMLGSLGLLVLGMLPQFRVAAGGNEAWVVIAGQSMQPGEIAKLGLALWLGLMLAQKQHQLNKLRHVMFPAGVGVLLVLAGVLHTKDLGTALIYFMLIAGALWVAGVPTIMFALAGMIGAGVVTAFVVTSPNRIIRIAQFLGLREADPLGLELQPMRALQGFGTGGLSGVGLGASREKWLYLPEPHNDYIFAIIGEELGLLGSLVVLALFLALTVGMTRVVKRHPDPFVKIATGGIGAWILGQAIINIGVAIKVFPVVGVPLPLISAGGSSLITTLFALAFVIGFARSEPGCQEALAARRFRFRESLAVLAPGRGRGK